MKVSLVNIGRVVYLGRFENEYNNNGRTGTSYKLSVKTDSGAGALPCTKDAYDEAAAFPEFVDVLICGDYDPDFRNFKVSGIKLDQK